MECTNASKVNSRLELIVSCLNLDLPDFSVEVTSHALTRFVYRLAYPRIKCQAVIKGKRSANSSSYFGTRQKLEVIIFTEILNTVTTVTMPQPYLCFQSQ